MNPNHEIHDEVTPGMNVSDELIMNSKMIEHFSYGPREKLEIFELVDEGIVKTISKCWLSMKTLKDEAKYNQTYVQNIDKLSIPFVCWRRVRGDGNCYYRAVITNYILRIFHYYQHKNRIYQLIVILNGLSGNVPSDFVEARDWMAGYLSQIYNSRDNIQIRKDAFLNVNQWLQDEEFDLRLVKVARFISYYTFMNNFGEYADFMLEDEKGAFVEKLLMMGKEAEGMELLLLPLGLGIYVEQINIFSNLLYSYYPSEPTDADKIKISIICKMQGHYDMLLTVQEMEDEEYNIGEGIYYYDPVHEPVEVLLVHN